MGSNPILDINFFKNKTFNLVRIKESDLQDFVEKFEANFSLVPFIQTWFFLFPKMLKLFTSFVELVE